jgi:hypothetical protein
LNKIDSTVPAVVRKNRPDVTNPDKVFGVRQRSCRFRNKSGSCAAALQMQRRNCDGSTRFATDQRRFFSEPTGRTIVEAGRLPRSTKSMRHWASRQLKDANTGDFRINQRTAARVVIGEQRL